jgi:hypothetical protein
MPKEGAIFTETAAGRIADTVEFVEGQRAKPKLPQTVYPRPTDSTGTAAAFVVVRDWEDVTDQTLFVSPVKQNEAGVWEFVMSDGVPAVQRMLTHPHARAEHYVRFAQRVGNELVDGVPVMLAVRVGGAWYVEQTVRFGMPLQDTRFAVGGCLPRLLP